MMWQPAMAMAKTTATAPAAVPHLFGWHFLAKTDNLLVPHVRCAKFHGDNNSNNNHNASKLASNVQGQKLSRCCIYANVAGAVTETDPAP